MLSDEDQDTVFHALASTVRRRMLDVIQAMPGCSVNDVLKYFEMSRIGVMKHLDVLVAADLVVSRKTGRVRALYLNAVPLQAIHDRWASEYAAHWAAQALDFKFRLEHPGQVAPVREVRAASPVF